MDSSRKWNRDFFTCHGKKRRANPSMNNPVLIGSVGRQLVIRNGAAPYLHTTNGASHQTEFILLHVFTKKFVEYPR